MNLLLARHGNTFEAGVEPYIIGRGEDLPLTAAGEAQARALAACLRRNDIHPDVVLCGALQRTRRMAAIICAELDLPGSMIEERLTELDYGDWSGLTSAEIKARYGEAAYTAWETQSIMPAGRHWQPASADLQENLAGLIDSLAGATTLAITSNGILRFIPRVLGITESRLPAAHLKVKTGHFCGFSRPENTWNLAFWNEDPKLFNQLPDKIIT